MSRETAECVSSAFRALIRRYLNAGMMADGVVMERLEGTPQGGRCHRC
jgi:RNA-directed DNA polymerase